MTYEYRCSCCSYEFEATQSIKDEPLKACPQCHEKSLERLISGGAGFSLKGGGWYKDLYSSTNKTS